MREPPPRSVLEAFEAYAEPVPLAGGEGTSWAADALVLKPVQPSMSEEQLHWQATTLGSTRFEGVRVALPVPARDGRLSVDGWYAMSRLEGQHEEGRWRAVIAAGEQVHAALADVPRPDFLDARDDPWAIGDRVAWGELDPAPHLESCRPAADLGRLLAALEPLDEPAQVVHGDLTGNVLFAEGLPPAVIDFAPYWRPRSFASGVVVADALVWEGAGRDLLDAAPRQHVLRALAYRLVVTCIFGGADDFGPAIELVLDSS